MRTESKHVGSYLPTELTPSEDNVIMTGVEAPQKISATAPRSHLHFARTWLAILFGLFVFYAATFLRYRSYDIDNPWFLSFSYNTCVEHIYHDAFMNVRFPAGMDGTFLFGKLAAYVQFAALGKLGWQQWPAMLLSSSFVLFSLGIWGLLLRRLGYTSAYVNLFLVAVGFSEPFVSAAEKFRYEPFSFGLLSIGLLLISYEWVAVGVFLGALAVEIQPIACVGLIPILVFTFWTRKFSLALVFRFMGALLIAGCLYFVLHPSIMNIRDYLSNGQMVRGASRGGMLAAYFVQRPRHLPELVCFLIAGPIYWRTRRTVQSNHLAISCLAMALVSVFIPHGNASYMIFIYPFLVSVALSAYRVELRAGLALALVLLYAIPQYVVWAYLNGDRGYRTEDIRQVSGTIATVSKQLGISDDAVKIYGDYGLWFAHPHLYEAATRNTVQDADRADLYLCYERSIQIEAFSPTDVFYCPDLKRLVPLRLIATVTVHGNELYLYTKR